MLPPSFELGIEPSNGHIPWYTRLWAAVVRRASVDWVLYRGHENKKLRRLGDDADLWLFNNDDDHTVGAFLTVCGFLNIEPSVIRSKVSSLTEVEARRLRGMEFGDEW